MNEPDLCSYTNEPDLCSYMNEPDRRGYLAISVFWEDNSAILIDSL